MHVYKTNFRGNPNVGMYIYVTDSYCLAGTEVPDEQLQRLAEVFEVPVHRMTIAGTGLLGVFLAGNSQMLLVPAIVADSELRKLDNLGIAYTVIDTLYTALGNNIAASDKGALVSDECSPTDIDAIAAALGVDTKPFKIRDVSVVGSCILVNKNGCVVHRGVQQFEEDMISQTLGLPITKGTVNLGNPYVRSGFAANSKGLIAGDLSGGPEMVNAEEALR